MDALALRLCEVFLSLRVKICLRLRRHLRANKGLSSCAPLPLFIFPPCVPPESSSPCVVVADRGPIPPHHCHQLHFLCSRVQFRDLQTEKGEGRKMRGRKGGGLRPTTRQVGDDNRRSRLRASVRVQNGVKKILLSSVKHVPSGLIGCALAAKVSGQKEGGKIQTCRNFFARPCTSTRR